MVPAAWQDAPGRKHCGRKRRAASTEVAPHSQRNAQEASDECHLQPVQSLLPFLLQSVWMEQVGMVFCMFVDFLFCFSSFLHCIFLKNGI